MDSHNSASRHVLGHVKAWEGGRGHSEGICRGPGTESKCERQKTQRSGGRNCHKVRLVLYGRKKKSHFAGKMDFLAKGKKSYHLEKVILSKEWFSPQKVTFFSV